MKERIIFLNIFFGPEGAKAPEEIIYRKNGNIKRF